MIYNRYLDSIKSYEAGKPIELVVREFGVKPEDVVKLASNENPLGVSPKASKAIAESATKANLYPDDSMYELKAQLSKKFNVEDKNLIIGAGSDQVLEFISHIKLNENSKILTSKVTFAMYDIYAKSFGAEVIKTDNYRHIVDEFREKIEQENPDIVYICTPNNPTGDATKREDVFKIIESTPKESLVVIDGAYMEYVDDESYKITPNDILNFENVIYLGTLSKAYGFGGMRVGYGVANSSLIKLLNKVRPPFNVTTLSLVGAVEALKDEEFLNKSIKLNREQMQRYIEFANRFNLEYIESFTNFITYLFDDRYNSTKISNNLMRKGVIIRDLASYGINGVRITIGTDEQNSRLFEVLESEL